MAHYGAPNGYSSPLVGSGSISHMGPRASGAFVSPGSAYPIARPNGPNVNMGVGVNMNMGMGINPALSPRPHTPVHSSVAHPAGANYPLKNSPPYTQPPGHYQSPHGQVPPNQSPYQYAPNQNSFVSNTQNSWSGSNHDPVSNTLPGPPSYSAIQAPQTSPGSSKTNMRVNPVSSQNKHNVPPKHRDNHLKVIGNYDIDKPIGEGSYAKVKLARHRLTNEKVALKIFDKKALNPKHKELEKVLTEIQILRVVNHPNLIRLVEVIETDDEFYLALEYADGGELFDYIVSHGRISEREGRRIFRQIFEAVEYLHANNIAHRDLKPENVLLDRSRNVRLIDFGMATFFTASQPHTETCGSLAYAAPEMLLGRPYECTGIDVWSMGVMLYALLAGYLPFEDQDQRKLQEKIIRGKVVYPSFLSKEAKDLIRIILNTNPRERPTLQQIKTHPWMDWSAITTEPTLQLLPQDTDVMTQMEGLGYEADLITKAITTKACNDAYATYILFLLKKRRNTKDNTKTAPRRPASEPAAPIQSQPQPQSQPQSTAQPITQPITQPSPPSPTQTPLQTASPPSPIKPQNQPSIAPATPAEPVRQTRPNPLTNPSTLATVKAQSNILANTGRPTSPSLPKPAANPNPILNTAPNPNPTPMPMPLATTTTTATATIATTPRLNATLTTASSQSQSPSLSSASRPAPSLAHSHLSSTTLGDSLMVVRRDTPGKASVVGIAATPLSSIGESSAHPYSFYSSTSVESRRYQSTFSNSKSNSKSNSHLHSSSSSSASASVSARAPSAKHSSFRKFLRESFSSRSLRDIIPFQRSLSLVESRSQRVDPSDPARSTTPQSARYPNTRITTADGLRMAPDRSVTDVMRDRFSQPLPTTMNPVNPADAETSLHVLELDTTLWTSTTSSKNPDKLARRVARFLARREYPYQTADSRTFYCETDALLFTIEIRTPRNPSPDPVNTVVLKRISGNILAYREISLALMRAIK